MPEKPEGERGDHPPRGGIEVLCASCSPRVVLWGGGCAKSRKKTPLVTMAGSGFVLSWAAKPVVGQTEPGIEKMRWRGEKTGKMEASQAAIPLTPPRIQSSRGDAPPLTTCPNLKSQTSLCLLPQSSPLLVKRGE